MNELTSSEMHAVLMFMDGVANLVPTDALGALCGIDIVACSGSAERIALNSRSP